MSSALSGDKFEVFDPYVGRVFGNILDQYDNPAYVLTLSVMPPPDSVTESGSDAQATQGDATTPADLVQQGVSPGNIPTGNPLDRDSILNSSGNDARGDTPSPSKTTTTVSSKRKVIVAQTGVTSTQIDDLEITTVPNNVTPNAIGVVKFTISQPGAANLLDQIQFARKYLGYTESQLSFGGVITLLLEIEFKGYTSDINDSEAGGEIASIAGPYPIQLTVNEFNVRMDQTGSYYDFQCTPTDHIGFADFYFKSPASFTSRGKTITEHVNSYVSAYNKYLAENSTDYERPDEIVFDLSELVGKKAIAPGVGGAATVVTINDDSVTSPDTAGAESQGSAMNNESAAATAEEKQAQLRANPTDSGRTDSIAAAGAGEIVVKEGTDVHKYIGTLLSMNTEFLNNMSRKSNINDPSDDTVNEEQTFITWYGVKSNVQYVKWDSRRNDYTKKITFTPYLYFTGRGDIALTLNEYSYLDKARKDDGVRVATKRLQDIVAQGNLRKSYYYLFTGKNDQILNLDITYDGAHQLILPPKGGYTSDVTLTSSQNLSVQIPENKDMSLREVFGKAKRLRDGNLFKDALAQLSRAADSLEGFAAGIGSTASELKSAIADSTGRSAQLLVDALDSATLRQAAAALDGSPVSKDLIDTPTQNGTITSQGFGEYVPEISGQIYASDFVAPNGALTIEELEDAGYIEADPAIVGQNIPPVVNVDIPNQFGDAIYQVTTPANMLFGFVYRQALNTNFMHAINMTLRGDPWYLGINPKTGRLREDTVSTAESVSVRGDNFFILQIGSPSAFDPRVDDEDANTGYWNSDISNSLSGVYRMRLVVNRFSRGIFTSELEATREQTIPLHLIRPLRPGEQQTVDFSDVDDSASAGIFGVPTAPTDTASGDAGSVAISQVPLQPPANSEQARAAASQYLGRSISDEDWNLLLRATAAESSPLSRVNPREDANVMAVILNRVKSPLYPNTIQGVLSQRAQFSSVTGPTASRVNFNQPNNQRIAAVANSIATNLNTIQIATANHLNFTANNPAAYRIPGDQNIGFMYQGRNTPGSEVINNTVFFTARGK